MLYTNEHIDMDLLEYQAMRKETIMFPGRYQPLHEGHITLIRSALDKGYEVVVAIRDTVHCDYNPYTVEQRKAMVVETFGDTVQIAVIPDFSEIWVGRKVGYKVVQLSKDIESISGTETRTMLRDEGLL